jgi:hypothetical protein
MNGEFYVVNRPFINGGPWYAEGTGGTIFWGQSFDDAHKFKSIPEIQEYISALLKKPDLFMPLELNTWVITRYSPERVDILDVINETHTMELLGVLND